MKIIWVRMWEVSKFFMSYYNILTYKVFINILCIWCMGVSNICWRKDGKIRLSRKITFRMCLRGRGWYAVFLANKTSMKVKPKNKNKRNVRPEIDEMFWDQRTFVLSDLSSFLSLSLPHCLSFALFISVGPIFLHSLFHAEVFYTPKSSRVWIKWIAKTSISDHPLNLFNIRHSIKLYLKTSTIAKTKHQTQATVNDTTML